ncbi:zinc-binding dehydrogenase [Nitrospirota bacterium]
MRSLGADKVVDYTNEDFTKKGEIYDHIFDTVGKSPYSGCLRSLDKNGFYLRGVNLELVSILRGLWVSMTSGIKVVGGVAHESVEDLVFLRELIEAGKLRPVVDKVYPLEQIVEAHRHVATGHKKGNIVITV